MSLFVTLDGVDGSGKTTVAQLLAADGSFQYYKSPGSLFQELRAEVDLRAEPVGRYCFYQLSNHFDSVAIGHLLRSGSVVCDRFVASTAAYHFAMDPRIKSLHCDSGLLKPDFAFFLNARPEVRNLRIRERELKRGRALSDQRLEQDSVFLDRVVEEFASLGLLRIDTSDTTPEGVVAIIRRMVGKGG